ncbi:MAG TPA: hypothetical protein PK322_03825 [Opitutaceae bacterium]|nr:hypothetical protein [Opitutaceae bacterium]
MAKSTPTLAWVITRLGDDHNWWVEELSDTVHWDVDGLSIIDPRQIDHIVELCEPLREYGLDLDDIDTAFIPFRIDKDLGEGRVRLVRVRDSFLESEEKLFALPDVVDEENGPYADFLDQITRARVKMLNDLFDFEQKLTVDEVEDQLREEQSNRFMEAKSIHLFDEVIAILDYVPEGWEADDDAPIKAAAEESEDEFPDIEDDEDEEKLKGDASLKWDEDEEDAEGEEDEDAKAKDKHGARGEEGEETDDEDEEEEDDDEAEEEEEQAPRGRRSRS